MHIAILKFISMFVVRELLKLIINDKFYHKHKTKQTLWGGVSVQVRSLIECLSFNSSRSDHSSLFNYKSIIMREQTDKSAKSRKRPFVGTKSVDLPKRIDLTNLSTSERFLEHSLQFIESIGLYDEFSQFLTSKEFAS